MSTWVVVLVKVPGKGPSRGLTMQIARVIREHCGGTLVRAAAAQDLAKLPTPVELESFEHYPDMRAEA